MKIRKANLQDIAKAAELFDQYRVWYKKESDLAGGIQFLTSRMENKESVLYIAEDDQGVFAGFTQLYPLFSSTRMKRLWLLNDLFVHPDYRGQGVSKMLIDAAKELCRSTDGCAVILETGKGNKIGNQLYPANDFELNTSHNYYEWSV